MPELPEVETVVRALRKKLPGLLLKEIKEYRPGTVSGLERFPCQGVVVQDVKRRGKYIVVQSSAIQILVHLRMTGKLVFSGNGILDGEMKHVRGEFIFPKGISLLFHDVRTFGTISLYPANMTPPPLRKLGMEPLSHSFTWKKLKERLRGRKAPVKKLLLNQEIIAGLGNIYVNEILYKSGTAPIIPGKEISDKKMKSVVGNTKSILKRAILLKGTTLSDYRQITNEKGGFQDFLNIYGKEKCPLGHEVRMIRQGGRSTYFCPICQK